MQEERKVCYHSGSCRGSQPPFTGFRAPNRINRTLKSFFFWNVELRQIKLPAFFLGKKKSLLADEKHYPFHLILIIWRQITNQTLVLSYFCHVNSYWQIIFLLASDNYSKACSILELVICSVLKARIYV